MDSNKASIKMPSPIWWTLCWQVMPWLNKEQKVKWWLKIHNNNKIWKWWSNNSMPWWIKIWWPKNSNNSNNKTTFLISYPNNRTTNKTIWILFGTKLDRLKVMLWESRLIHLQCRTTSLSSSNHGWTQWWWIDLWCINSQCNNSNRMPKKSWSSRKLHLFSKLAVTWLKFYKLPRIQNIEIVNS